MNDENLLIQEVEELTELLRSDPAWNDLRQALRSKGVSIETCFLAGFLEDEAENEYGVVVTYAGEAFEFERSTRTGARGFNRWERTERIEELAEKAFPAVRAALAMTRDTPTTPYRS
jgi:hypothetical protein